MSLHIIQRARDIREAKGIYDTFNQAEPKTTRYAPAFALAMQLQKHRLLLDASNLIEETWYEASSCATSVQHHFEDADEERAGDLAACEAAYKEFFIDVGGDPRASAD